jgi:hypothetical protein
MPTFRQFYSTYHLSLLFPSVLSRFFPNSVTGQRVTKWASMPILSLTAVPRMFALAVRVRSPLLKLKGPGSDYLADTQIIVKLI